MYDNNNSKGNFKPKPRVVVGECPVCGRGEVVKNAKGWGCNQWKEGCKLFIGTICGVTLTLPQVKELISTGSVGPLGGFLSKRTGKKFSAKLVLNGDKIEFNFDKE